MKNKELTDMHKRLLSILPRGIDNPRTVDEIAKTLNIDTRYTNQLINELNLKYGIPTGAIRTGKNIGVFIPMNEEEKQLGMVSLKNQTVSMQRRIEAIEKADIKEVNQYLKEFRITTKFVFPFKQLTLNLENKE